MRLAVFDCDGTLVDSQANIIAAMGLAFAAHGLATAAPHAVRQIVGLSVFEAVAALLPHGGRALQTAVAADFKLAYQRLRADGELDHEPLYPGIATLLTELERRGWVLGVATGKSDRGLAIVLAQHGLAGHFITLQTADRHPSKPHPAMLEAAIAAAGAAPETTAMIGDTRFDMAMAANAGVRGLGVDWGYHDAHELRAAGAAGVARDTGELLALLEA